MLKKGRQRAHFNEVWESMLAHLLAFCETRDSEALHRFRVQVKKIRTQPLFLQKGLDNKLIEPLLTIFRQAGVIRSTHVHLTLMERHRITHGALKSKQEKIALAETKRFCSKLDAHVKTLKKLRKEISANIQCVDKKTVRRYCKKQMKQLAHLFAQPAIPVIQLHQSRKKIKKLLYLHDALPKSFSQKLKMNVAQLGRLQDAIGRWRDVVSLATLLKKEGVTDESTFERLARQRKKASADVQCCLGAAHIGSEQCMFVAGHKKTMLRASEWFLGNMAHQT